MVEFKIQLDHLQLIAGISRGLHLRSAVSQRQKPNAS
jgi:hypothetical protein